MVNWKLIGMTEKLFWNNYIDCSVFDLIRWNVGAVFLLIGLVMWND